MVQSIIDGQKAGESSARQPVIAPDSARSVTKLKQVIGLAEGEIKGFGKDDIKLDGTPLSALSSEIICDYRFGTVGQEYIPGVEEVANEIGVGVELRGDLDWIKLITNTDIDHVGIRLRWGPLQTSHSNGDVTGVFIHYTVSIAPVNGSYEKVLDATISDKTSDSYERYHEFKLPPSEDGWMIKVSRLTPSAQSSLVSDKMYVQAYAEIIKSKFTFPYTALIHLEYDARSFANVAKVAVNAKGMIIKVPSNYDPETRQYTGLWNGSFKMAYSNNPAWVYFDIVTQPRYGCGDRIDQSMVDKWSLYRLGQYCDQMVDDGYGGLEPRFTCNVYLQSKERAYDVLNRLTGLFRAFNFWNGSQLIVDADIPQDTSYLYTNANVVDGLFEYAGTAATDLYSAAKVAWDNPANGFNTEYEAVSYEHLIKKLGFKTLELDAWGCTSRGQALRAGRWALLAESDTVTFKVGMDGYLAMPGKIIEIQDEFYAGKSNGGRVISISSSGLEITLDRPVETIAGDTISFNTLAGTVKKYNIASSNGSVVTLTESVGSTIERMHIWAISSSQLATQKYRILTVKYDGIGEFTISAVEYNPNKYEDIDSNITFDEPPTSIINPIAQVAVKNVTISSNEYVYQGLNTVNLEIKWERAENAVEYLVELKKDDTTWLKLPPTGNNSIVLENVYAGYYIAKVTAVSAYELKSLPAYSAKTNVLGKQSMPLPPLNPRIVPIQFGIEFYWDFPQGATDTAVSRIVVAYLDPTGAVDDSGFLTYDKAYSDNKIVIQNLDLHTRVWFKVRLIDKLGFESPYTSWISGIPSQDFDKVMDLISGQIEQSDLYYDLSQKIDVGYGASAAATNAQTAANQAQASADQAQAAANQVQAQVTATTAELRGLLDVTADGLTQEILDRQEGDADVVGQLTTYKTSNDAAMSAVQQKAEAATSAAAANATALTNLNTEVAAAHNLASSALQQAQSATDATSTNASNLIALNSRMDSAVQAGDNLLVNSNVGKPYNGTYPHGVYNLGEAWEAGATYTLLWCASFVRKSPDQNILVLAAYAGGGMQGLQSIDTEGERQVHKVTFVVRPEGTGYNEVCFFLLSSNGGYLDAVATVHWAVLVKASDIGTKVWVRSKYDVDNAINTKLDASAINEYYTKVQADQAIAGQITTFESSLALGGGWIDIGREGAQPTIESGAGTIEVIDRKLNHFKITAMSDGLFSAYIGACNNSSSMPVGTPYVMTGKIRASRANLYDRIYARFNQYASESYIVGWNASSDWVTFKTSGVTNTQEQYPLNNIIGANVPNAIAGDWVEFKDCRISVNSDSVTAANSQAIRNTETNVATIDGKVTAQANQLTSLSAKLNERKVYQLYSGGLNAATGSMGWLRGFDPDSYYGIGRSYGLVVFNGDGSIQSVNSYDVYEGHTQGFIDAVAAVPPGTYVAVLTSDEPNNNSVHIKGALKSLGGSDAIDQVVGRGAYLLVGRKGLPTGQAIEKVSNTTSFGVDYLLEMYNGVPIGLGGSSPQAGIISNMRAEVSNLNGQVSSLAQQTSTLSTTVGNNTAAIQLQQSSIDGINAKATLKVEAGGTIGGVALGNNGGVVDFLIRSNTFAITTPEGVPNDTKYMMTYQANDQTLPNGTVIPKGLKVNDAIIGTINANKIYAESLSAISANLGTFTTANEKGTMKIAGTEISVKDINGVERIYIGL